jgi:enoyl-CoA hydratase
MRVKSAPGSAETKPRVKGTRPAAGRTREPGRLRAHNSRREGSRARWRPFLHGESVSETRLSRKEDNPFSRREQYYRHVRTAGGVVIEVDAGVAVVTIDRPDVRNAIGFATIDELDVALDQILASGPAVLVVRGGGDRAFVSGGDLNELSAIRTHEDAVRMARRVRRVLDRVAAFPVPVVAALNGYALGGGAEVAIAADIRIAADDVKIGFNQVALGIMPAWGGAERLARTIGRSRALLAIATGELYDAPTAARLGLVDIVVSRATFEDEWRALARRLAALAPGTTRAIKSVVAAAAPSVHSELEANATDAFAQLWTADAHWDAVEALEQRRRTG